MPHVREAAVASHDRHDLLLVAALAAGDLTGTDRDQALALTSSCAECAALHADLVAIARATTTVPPPITSSGRDFRLSPAQAASLRRPGWRRFLPAAGAMPLARPLGAALATLGIAGLLIGTQPLALTGGLGSAASTPVPAAAPAAIPEVGGAGSAPNDQALGPVVAASAAASAAYPVPAASSGAASMAPGSEFNANASAAASAVPAPDLLSAQPARSGSGSGKTAGAAQTAAPASSAQEQTSAGGQSAETTGGLAGTVEPPSSPSSTSPSPLILVSLAAVVGGVLLVVSSYRGRRTSL